MLRYAKQDKPVLPVHDSFIIISGLYRELVNAMHDIFKARYGVNIEIKEGEQKIEHLYGASEAGLDELLSYKDTSFEKRLDYFRQNNAK